MKRGLLIILLIFFPQVSAYANQDPLSRAMQHYTKHQYKQAADVLYEGLDEIKGKQPEKAALTMGMICLANAEIYRELYQASIMIHTDYFTKLITVDHQQGQNRQKCRSHPSDDKPRPRRSAQYQFCRQSYNQARSLPAPLALLPGPSSALACRPSLL